MTLVAKVTVSPRVEQLSKQDKINIVSFYLVTQEKASKQLTAN